jgi:hypothetical protein
VGLAREAASDNNREPTTLRTHAIAGDVLNGAEVRSAGESMGEDGADIGLDLGEADGVEDGCTGKTDRLEREAKAAIAGEEIQDGEWLGSHGRIRGTGRMNFASSASRRFRAKVISCSRIPCS